MKYLAAALIFLSPLTAFAAIAFDSSACSDANGCLNWNASGSTIAWNHTVTGSNPILFVCTVAYNNPVRTVSTVKQGTTAFTKLDSITAIEGANTIDVEDWYLLNPAVGSSTIRVTYSGSVSNPGAVSESYTGVNQTTPIDTHIMTKLMTSTASVSTTTQVNVSGDWLTGCAFARGSTISAGSATTLRSNNTGINLTNADSAGTVATGAQALAYTDAISSTWPGLPVVAFEPAASATVDASPILGLLRAFWLN